MKVEIWSDFTCPFCYIGKHHFEEALKRFEYADYVRVEYKSYETLQNANIVDDFKKIGSDDYPVSTEYEMVKEELRRQVSVVESNWNLEYLKPTSTFDAHRLLKYALNSSKSNALYERISYAYLIEGAYISNHDTLLQLATSIGLNHNDVSELLATNKYGSRVKCDQLEAEQIGVASLPFYIFDEKYAISGFQTSDVLIEVLEHVWSDFCKRPQPLKQRHQSETTSCSGESCEQTKDFKQDWL